MRALPTGEQYEITHDRWLVVVTEVGATLRSIQLDGRELLWTFGADEVPASSQGLQLVPWPNRIRDGRYQFGGTEYQLPISEVPRQNAIHGLNHGRPWQLIRHDDDGVEQQTTFYPQKGWPGVLTVSIRHTLSADGLRVEVEARNDGSHPVPYGYGVHPYFAFGEVSDVVLQLPFNNELLVDPERLLPQQIAEVSAEKDFRDAHPVEDANFDTAFCSPSEPQWAVQLQDATHAFELWADESMPWVQVFTPPARNAIAVEPMTCGPDAFNQGVTHDDLITLAPGDSTRSVWGVRSL